MNMKWNFPQNNCLFLWSLFFTKPDNALVVKSQNSECHWTWPCFSLKPDMSSWAVVMDGAVWDTDLPLWPAVRKSSSLSYSFRMPRLMIFRPCEGTSNAVMFGAGMGHAMGAEVLSSLTEILRSAGPFRHTVIDLIWPICRVEYVKPWPQRSAALCHDYSRSFDLNRHSV